MHRNHPFRSGVFKCLHRILRRGMTLSHKKLRFIGTYPSYKVIYSWKDFAHIPEMAAVARITTEVNGFTATLNQKASPQIAIGVAPIPSPPMPGGNIINLDTFLSNVLLIPSCCLNLLSRGKGR